MLRKVNPGDGPVSTALGILGITGITGVPGIDQKLVSRSPAKRYWSLRRPAPSAALSGRSRAVLAVMLSG